MKNSNKYSLIAPVYNEMQHIKECVKNILDQFDQFKLEAELIIVDDCSTDETLTILKKIADQRVRIYRTPENSGGAGVPRNLGIKNATGDYVLFYDFGDVIDLSRIDDIVASMCNKGSNVAIANHVDIDVNEQITESPLSIFKEIPYVTNFAQLPRLIHNPFCWAKVFKLNWLKSNNILFGDQYCGEDKVFTWKAYLAEANILIHPHILYGHRFFGENVNRMLQRNFKLIESLISIDESIYPEFVLKKLEHVYAKRVLVRDLLGIVLEEKSILKLRENDEYERSIDKLNKWLQIVVENRIEFYGVLNMRQREYLKSLFGGVFELDLNAEKNLYWSEGYKSVLTDDELMADPSKKNEFVIALHLPQYHTDPDNDKNWGKGFTEWTNVTKAQSLYKGHKQPKLPSDLGFYDLRMHENRIEQMRLAKYHGVDAFCYYHYWFSGKTVIEKPLSLMLENKSENFPFMLCWANETWSGIWHGAPNRILIEQKYPGEEDYSNYFNHLLPFFKDERYLKIDNKPLFAVWQPLDIPDTSIFLDTFRKLAKLNGFNGMHMIGMHHFHKGNPLDIDFDRSIPLHMPRLLNTQDKIPSVHDFELIYNDFIPREYNDKVYPCITPNWDNTPRSGVRGMVFENNNPGIFYRQFKNLLEWSKSNNAEKIVFIKAWNEWAEGNCLEPDREWGLSYLNVIKKTLNK